MIQYKVISHSLIASFESLVNAALKDGWKLQGGVSTHNFFYSQAVVKEDKPVKQKT